LNAVVNYVSNSRAPDDLINAEYVLIPVRLVRGPKPMHDLLVFQNFDTDEMPAFEGYTLKKNYGKGVIFRPRHSGWKNGCDSLTVVGLHENWTMSLRFQVSGFGCQE
jgi:hypothetical protein